MRELKESVFLYSVLSILYQIMKLCDMCTCYLVTYNLERFSFTITFYRTLGFDESSCYHSAPKRGTEGGFVSPGISSLSCLVTFLYFVNGLIPRGRGCRLQNCFTNVA